MKKLTLAILLALIPPVGICDDDSELAEVEVAGTRIQPRTGSDGVRCNPVSTISFHATPEQLAADAADPELRKGREAVMKYLFAEMTRSRSVLWLDYSHSEIRGDEIWYTYNRHLVCTRVVSAAQNQTTMSWSWNRKTGEIKARNP